jgi:hypothetical protein
MTFLMLFPRRTTGARVKEISGGSRTFISSTITSDSDTALHDLQQFSGIFEFQKALSSTFAIPTSISIESLGHLGFVLSVDCYREEILDLCLFECLKEDKVETMISEFFKRSSYEVERLHCSQFLCFFFRRAFAILLENPEELP